MCQCAPSFYAFIHAVAQVRPGHTRTTAKSLTGCSEGSAKVRGLDGEEAARGEADGLSEPSLQTVSRERRGRCSRATVGRKPVCAVPLLVLHERLGQIVGACVRGDIAGRVDLFARDKQSRRVSVIPSSSCLQPLPAQSFLANSPRPAPDARPPCRLRLLCSSSTPPSTCATAITSPRASTPRQTQSTPSFKQRQTPIPKTSSA